MKIPLIRPIPWMTILTLLMAAALCAASPPVSVEFGDKGVEQILWQGKNYAGDGRIAIQSLRVEEEEGKFRDAQGKLLDYKVDAAAKKVVADYEGATLSCTYATEGNRVDLFAEVTNKTAQPCVYLSLKLGELDLLKNIDNKPATEGGTKAVDNAHVLGLRRLVADGAVVALGNWEVSSPARVNTGLATATGYPIVLETPLVAEQPSHPVVEARHFAMVRRVIAPGATDRFHVSLSFAAPETEHAALCPEVLRHIAKERPMRLKWDDRRAIGTLFIATSFKKWPTNMRGFVFGKGKDNDVTTPEGLKAFGEALMAYADTSVKILKEMDAQGVIVWDVEGQEMAHPISYLGDPRNLKETTPEMEPLADEFFKKFTDAGFKVGITIRPTRIVPYPGKPGKWTHIEVPDPVQEMSDKIAYAQKRWGCTIFYLDSNAFNADWITKEQKAQMKGVQFLMPVAMMEELQRRHPDVLVIPEQFGATYYAVGAPYAGVNIGQRGTPPFIRKIYPEAFSVVMPNRSALEQNWEAYSERVTGGDILLFQAWYPDPGNELVKLIYEEAAFRKSGVPAQVQGASFDALSAMAAGTDARSAYYAAEALGGSTDPRVVPLLVGLLDNPNLLVRKNAIIALGKLHAGNAELIQHMMEVLRDPKMGMLAPFAADTLGAMGPEAVPSIQELLDHKKMQMQYYGVRAVKTQPAMDAAVLEKTLALLASPDATLREATIKTLGEKKVAEAVPQLVQALSDETETVSIAAVRALGEIGDKRAVEPLVKLYDRPFRTVVIYNIRDAQDTALRQITGEKESRDAPGWKAWQG